MIFKYRSVEELWLRKNAQGIESFEARELTHEIQNMGSKWARKKKEKHY